VVEDNLLVNELLAEALRDWGYQTLSAVDATSAAGAMDRGPFDLLIVDYQLPDMTGDEVLRDYRSRNRHGSAVVVSGMPLSSELPAGPVRFLQKPFTIPSLAATLTALGQSVRHNEIA
jgi:CheY-like chemotaxis protein